MSELYECTMDVFIDGQKVNTEPVKADYKPKSSAYLSKLDAIMTKYTFTIPVMLFSTGISCA